MLMLKWSVEFDPFPPPLFFSPPKSDVLHLSCLFFPWCYQLSREVFLCFFFFAKMMVLHISAVKKGVKIIIYFLSMLPAR